MHIGQKTEAPCMCHVYYTRTGNTLYIYVQAVSVSTQEVEMATDATVMQVPVETQMYRTLLTDHYI